MFLEGTVFCVLMSLVSLTAGGVVPPMMIPPPGKFAETQIMGPPFPLVTSPFIPHPGCLTPYEHQIHLMRRSYLPKGQGQWNTFPAQQLPIQVNKGQGQFKPVAGQLFGNDQWNIPANQWSDQVKFNQFPIDQGQWNQMQFQGQAQWNLKDQANGKWQQPTWNEGPNVQMIGQWDGVPTQSQFVNNPRAVNNVVNTEQTFKPMPLDEGAFGPFDGSKNLPANAPVQNRPLR